MHKGMIQTVLILVGVMIAVPAVLVSLGHSLFGGSDKGEKTSPPSQVSYGGPDVKVYVTEEKKVLTIPLEQYIRGVVAAEMPADFHMEALKAQSLAARTYMADRMKRGDYSDMKKWGKPGSEAHVTDTVQHQVYLSDKKLKQNWEKKYKEYSDRVTQAVRETEGQIIQYQGEPIYAAFFSTSNGRTENSEDYFEEEYPYLRSVPSPWDKSSPKYEDRVSFTKKDFLNKLVEKTGKQVALSASSGNGWIKVLETTEGGRIGKLQVGDQQLTGRQVREALDLSSSDFSWEIKGDRITLTTRGYGHGVGMSQWGANLLAREGKKAKDIIRYYYRGVEIMPGQYAQSP
ncbi:stage II sporulation protein D [Kroppenstedtia pulmonis]|uniref:Stage II sporulation protein D n=1 Tax=Kroppenstedtia pulmonis TaxID=1380685 RepID=A0A7D3Y1X9_9BACL|nr:stage II sporulation protein D [Kroppenstedtia pulmonis]QKG85700.1 stage II sporulation protein D [Kroppenstedtia pulmonis]